MDNDNDSINSNNLRKSLLEISFKDQNLNKVKNKRKTRLSLMNLDNCDYTDYEYSEAIEKLIDFINWEFDYEINLNKIEKNSVKCFINTSSTSITFNEVKFDNFDDTINIEINNGMSNLQNMKINKANCIKRMVSQKKRRFETDLFDLDMAYITKRIIAMGFPSKGCETFYRNSMYDVSAFVDKYYFEDGAKVYNLCMEKERIYDKMCFNKINYKKDNLFPVGLFPFRDHNPPSIKVILEFCVDICIYLIRKPKAVALIHCKAGKGRTGLMIVCYLLFTQLCKTPEEAIAHFAKMRTHDNKGITIPSQKRYVKYFYTFLKLNYNNNKKVKNPSYISMIPKIINEQFENSINSKNMIMNYLKDKSYFISPNIFILKAIRIGPFETKTNLDISMYNLDNSKYSYDYEVDIEEVEKSYIFHYAFLSRIPINTDVKFEIKGKINFYLWLNLWYSTMENLFKINEVINSSETEDENKKNLSNYLKTFNTSSNLNDLIFIINKCLNNTSTDKVINNHLTIRLDSESLDKFDGKKQVSKEFNFELTYEIM